MPEFTIDRVAARGVNVPMPSPHRTASGVVLSYPMVLIDLVTKDGVTGASYLFTYSPAVLKPIVELINGMAPMVNNQPLAPLDLASLLDKRFRLLGVQGLVGMAIAGVDMAAWDALARTQQMPLARLLGAGSKSIPAYLSLGMDGLEDAPRNATEAVERGFRAIKIKIGYADAAADLAVIRAIRNAIGNEIKLMVDYNQSLSIVEAKRRLQVLANEELVWVEEPVRWEDFAGNAAVAAQSAIPIQMGENWWMPDDVAKAVEAKASHLAMLDVMKVGGVSGWLRAAALCAAHGIPVSSHLFPEFSAHLLEATPTAHWLEYQDWADPVLAAPYVVKEGRLSIPDVPGVGLQWNEDAVTRFRVC